MRLCLFIGHHKVGSTALQDFLARNAARLVQAGILYPAVESEGMAQLIRKLLDPDAEAGPGFNTREPHNALAFRLSHELDRAGLPRWHPGLPSVHQMLRAISNQVRILSPRAVVLCSEAFSTHARAPELAARLAAIFPGAEVSLHLTLRRPDDHLVSWHAQRLRFGDRLSALSGPGLAEYLSGPHVDYAQALSPWIAAFPDARLSVRRYEQVLAAGGSVEDFCAQSGLAFPSGLAPSRRMNLSLHPGLFELGRRATHRGPPERALRFVEALIDRSAVLAGPAAREVEMIGQANRRLLAEAFAPIEERLAQLIGRSVFPDAARITELRPVPEVEAARQLIGPLIASLSPDMARLARDLASVGGVAA